MEKCNCFETHLELIKENAKADLEKKGVKFENFSADWEDRLLFLQGPSDHAPVNLHVGYKYRQLKKDDTPYKNMTTKRIGMMMSYCPFCGRKYGDDDE